LGRERAGGRARRTGPLKKNVFLPLKRKARYYLKSTQGADIGRLHANLSQVRFQREPHFGKNTGVEGKTRCETEGFYLSRCWIVSAIHSIIAAIAIPQLAACTDSQRKRVRLRSARFEPSTKAEVNYGPLCLFSQPKATRILWAALGGAPCGLRGLRQLPTPAPP